MDQFIFLGAGTGAFLAFLVVLITTLMILFGLKRAREKASHFRDPYISFPISVLKPLKGEYFELEENLEAFFQLEYPRFELIFSVEDAADPACAVVQRLMDRYPDVDAQLIIANTRVGLNPKINNLVLPYQLASYDFLLVSDSPIRPDPAFLRRIASYWEPQVGLVSAAVISREFHGVGGALEGMALNTFQLRAAHLSRWRGNSVFTNKVFLFRRPVLEQLGGMPVWAAYLSDQGQLEASARRLNLKHRVMAEPITQQSGPRQWRDFWRGQLRGHRLRKATAPLKFAAEPWLGPLLWSGLLAGLPWTSGLERALAATLVWLSWGLCDLWLLRALRVELTAGTFFSWLGYQLLSPMLWVQAVFGNTVTWQGHRFRVGGGGRLTGSEAEDARFSPVPTYPLVTQ